MEELLSTSFGNRGSDGGTEMLLPDTDPGYCIGPKCFVPDELLKYEI